MRDHVYGDYYDTVLLNIHLISFQYRYLSSHPSQVHDSPSFEHWNCIAIEKSTDTVLMMAQSRKFQEMSNRIAPPSHRHAAPSAPWPWVDIQDDGEPKILYGVFLLLKTCGKKLIVGSSRLRDHPSLLHVTIKPVITVGKSTRNHYSPTGLLLKSRKAKST